MATNNLEQQAYDLLRQNHYQEAINIYEELLADNPHDLNYCYLGLAWLLQGDATAAQEVWLTMMLESVENSAELVEVLLNILDEEILIQISSNNLRTASIIYAQIKEIEPDYLNLQLNISKILSNWQQEAAQLRLSRQLELAKEKYQSLVNFAPESPDLWQSLALINYELFNFDAALEYINQAIALNQQNFIYYYNAGLILEKMNRGLQAVETYKQAIYLNPQHLDSYNNLGNLLFNLQQLEAAAQFYRQAIALQPNNYGSYINFGNLLMYCGEIESALNTYKQAVNLSNDPEIYFWVVNNIRSYNYIQEAITFAQDNAHLFPDNPFVRIESKRILPFVYQNAKEIDNYRKRLEEFIDSLLKINLTERLTLAAANNLIQRHTNYHLHYQAKNDLDLQSKYGLFVQRVMSGLYPQFSIKPVHTQGEKIKVGYISYCLKNHVVGKLALGWVKNHDPQRFQVYCYYLGDKWDNVTREFQQFSYKLSHHSNADNLEIIGQQIVRDELDILVFLDLGMYPRMTQLASLKLAPIQCVTWMHPITSGIPNIDYFISGELLEGEKSSQHYTEQLVTLPNLSIYYQPRELPKVEPDRSKFKLSPQAVVYLSSQFPSKYLPQYDYLFPAIATEVKNAQFVFVHPLVHQGKNESIYEQLWTRIKQAFADYNLNAEDYCIFLPTLKNSEDYWHLFLACDLFLDTIGFTGFNSTLDAIESHLPVVTHQGEFFRTRQSAGILTMIQVTETIATSEKEYLELAIKLGLDSQWRHLIVEKIKANLKLLYHDLETVKALETFYQTVINAEPGT
ncbi:tetratricopeptide repeat protein [Gloeocapsa sp. PCC 73106]|uniref:O-linked N-acetylglucosamine transferase, SPINDLY family protein n=1 Tax=Gloeocapsa sp. PCC 73106 TaxID=102232 RepID=UPI0008FBEB2F|nr:tetratricopeptide repeat protein [Gloeocapsa sp. PCC 73106]